MTDSTDMTIRDVRVTVLRMPWANPAWIKGHALGPDRGILIVDVETAGGITGMGYLFHFRPGLRRSRHSSRKCVVPRVKGKDATAVEAIWKDLWTFTMTYGRGGIACMAMSALDIALWDAVGKRAGAAAAPAVGPLPLGDSDLRLGLLPRRGRRRDDREGAAFT